MMFTSDDLTSFWSAPWTVPLRSACRWLALDVQTKVSPDATPGTWLRPLCVQRWVGQAILARFAWMRAHPEAAAYRYSGSSDESIPCWTEMSTVAYARRSLRELEEERILWLWVVEVERLLRVSEAPPCLVGEETWTRAALGVCEHLAQMYAELKRRHKAMRARLLLREALRSYVQWDYRAAA